ncbi:MAG: hypothetical protein J7M25_15490 [Deltaproteobacteria bacterium]|nr:hypothetical protein [Deltaproteobacteria bacterium]
MGMTTPWGTTNHGTKNNGIPEQTNQEDEVPQADRSPRVCRTGRTGRTALVALVLATALVGSAACNDSRTHSSTNRDAAVGDATVHDGDAALLEDAKTSPDAGPLPTVCEPDFGAADVSQPDHVVGDGSATSCTEAALRSAVSAGGVITFDCGSAPITITVTSQLEVTADTVIDGGDLVTLSGNSATRILAIPSSFELASPTLTVQHLTLIDGHSIRGNDDTDSGGGAIWSRGGNIVIVGCTFRNNSAPETGQDLAGGAIYNVGSGRVAITDSLFENNHASDGGAIGVLHADLAIYNTIITGNRATGTGGNPGNGGDGGGIYSDGTSQDESLCAVVLTNNQANKAGGGMFRVSNDNVGTMTFDRCTISDNSCPPSGDEKTQGGGLFLMGLNIDIRSTTISGNSASGSGGMFISRQTTLNMTNCTVANNTALTSLAGGLFMSADIQGTILNCTFSGNEAPGEVAFAGATVGGPNVVLKNSVMAYSVAGNGWNPITCRDEMHDGGGNIQWPVERSGGGSDDPDALCAAGALIQDPKLGDLADNGGPNETMMPASDSPAIGLGQDCPAKDQRGQSRQAACTAGSIEIQ